MAECHAVLGLLGKDDTFAGLYLDLVKATTDLLDAYFWLQRAETFDLRTPLLAIRDAASAALAEFDVRHNAAWQQRPAKPPSLLVRIGSKLYRIVRKLPVFLRNA